MEPLKVTAFANIAFCKYINKERYSILRWRSDSEHLCFIRSGKPSMRNSDTKKCFNVVATQTLSVFFHPQHLSPSNANSHRKPIDLTRDDNAKTVVKLDSSFYKKTLYRFKFSMEKLLSAEFHIIGYQSSLSLHILKCFFKNELNQTAPPKYSGHKKSLHTTIKMPGFCAVKN